MITDPWFYAVAIPAVVLLGLAKGGLAGVGTVGTPLLALVVPPVQAAAIALPILIVQDVVGVWAFRKSFDKAILTLMLPAAVLGIGLGWVLARYTAGGGVELALGLISIVFGLQRLWAERHQATPTRPIPRWLGFVCGAVSGFTSQVAHAGAPPFQIYVMPQRLPRDVLVGTTAIFFAIVNWLKVPAYIGLGQFTRETLSTSAVLLPLAIASTYAGVWVVRRLDGDLFYRLVYVLLVLVGAKLAFDGIVALRA
jgi:uncharacterized membrane protein YfcA